MANTIKTTVIDIEETQSTSSFVNMNRVESKCDERLQMVCVLSFLACILLLIATGLYALSSLLPMSDTRRAVLDYGNRIKICLVTAGCSFAVSFISGLVYFIKSKCF